MCNTQRTGRSGSGAVNHHLVSKGYQKNFATEDRRVAVVDARTGEIIDPDRAIRRNWSVDHWNTMFDPNTGQPDTQLEDAFAKIENEILDRIRRVRVGTLNGDDRRALVNLFAIHLTRSTAYREAQSKFYEKAKPAIIAELTADRTARQAFEAEFGRPPAPGELEEIAEQTAMRHEATNEFRVTGAASNHNTACEILSKLEIQVIEIGASLPGLPLGDVPIVHADSAAARYGFRDDLAVGDADLLFGPLTRHTAVCFTTRWEGHLRVTTKTVLKKIIGLQARASLAELACHPDDSKNIQQVCRRLPAAPWSRDNR